jgi:hypothetical protein
MIKPCLLVLPFILCGCANIIQSVDLAPGQTPDITSSVDFVVRGSGNCDVILDWGDGSKDVVDDAALAANPHFQHVFKGWRGGKTVTVTPVSPKDCKGMARTRFVTVPAVAELGWVRNPRGDTRSCVNFPGRPFLNPNSIVKITAPSMPQVNFGCGNNGCIYGPDGKSGSSAASPFEFPGFREYSLVLREGGASGRLFQGGTSAQFTSVTGGELEFCQNNDRPQNNITGGWQIGVRVDELGP